MKNTKYLNPFTAKFWKINQMIADGKKKLKKQIQKNSNATAKVWERKM